MTAQLKEKQFVPVNPTQRKTTHYIKKTNRAKYRSYRKLNEGFLMFPRKSKNI